jgi:hypothetical protein
MVVHAERMLIVLLVAVLAQCALPPQPVAPISPSARRVLRTQSVPVVAAVPMFVQLHLLVAEVQGLVRLELPVQPLVTVRVVAAVLILAQTHLLVAVEEVRVLQHRAISVVPMERVPLLRLALGGSPILIVLVPVPLAVLPLDS